MGTADRIIRVLIAVVIGVLYFTEIIPGMLGVILLILAGIFVLTSLISFCPLYAPFGLSTCSIKEQNKSANKTMMLVLLVGTIALGSCKKDDSPTIQAQVETSIQSGTWRITKFIDSGTDETSNYSGYNFTFTNSGSLSATNGTTSVAGTWSITDSNSDDDSQSDLDFNINFTQANFIDLSDDWDFLSQSEIKIELTDVSGGGGGTDYLTFEKN